MNATPRALGLLALALLATQARGIVNNAAADFSATSNPNGPWSFGYHTPTLGTGFTLNSASGVSLGLDYWASTTGPSLPAAFHNPSASVIAYGSSVLVDPGQLVLHPGPANEYSVARFTAPISASYTFSATFIGQDWLGGTTSDVHLLVNGAPVYSGAVSGYLNTASSGSFTMPLTALDTIEAAVGYGFNGNYFCDSTGLDFTVSYAPAPGALALLATGTLLTLRRRRLVALT